LAGKLGEPVGIAFERGGAAVEPDLLATAFSAWAQWAVMAPQRRLDVLEFAASSDGRALVRGRPLPPIPGQPLVIHRGVAVLAGWTWRPRVDPETLRESLGLIDDEIALLWPDGAWERVPHHRFVPASRQAVRESLSAIQGGAGLPIR
jgi:hypothetical protein